MMPYVYLPIAQLNWVSFLIKFRRLFVCFSREREGNKIGGKEKTLFQYLQMKSMNMKSFTNV